MSNVIYHYHFLPFFAYFYESVSPARAIGCVKPPKFGSFATDVVPVNESPPVPVAVARVTRCRNLPSSELLLMQTKWWSETGDDDDGRG